MWWKETLLVRSERRCLLLLPRRSTWGGLWGVYRRDKSVIEERRSSVPVAVADPLRQERFQGSLGLPPLQVKYWMSVTVESRRDPEGRGITRESLKLRTHPQPLTL